MIIALSPYGALPHVTPQLDVHKAGDVLTVNGTTFDFTPLPDGASLPASAIDSQHFAGVVERVDGEIHLTLRLPHGPNPSPEQAFPAPISVTEDGQVALPQPLPATEPVLEGLGTQESAQEPAA